MRKFMAALMAVATAALVGLTAVPAGAASGLGTCTVTSTASTYTRTYYDQASGTFKTEPGDNTMTIQGTAPSSSYRGVDYSVTFSSSNEYYTAKVPVTLYGMLSAGSKMQYGPDTFTTVPPGPVTVNVYASKTPSSYNNTWPLIAACSGTILS